MKTFKSLYLVFLSGGIIILLIGIFLQINQASSGGTGYTLDGGTMSGSINGTSAIILGCMVLVLALLFFTVYKRERKRFDDLDQND